MFVFLPAHIWILSLRETDELSQALAAAAWLREEEKEEEIKCLHSVETVVSALTPPPANSSTHRIE